MELLILEHISIYPQQQQQQYQTTTTTGKELTLRDFLTVCQKKLKMLLFIHQIDLFPLILMPSSQIMKPRSEPKSTLVLPDKFAARYPFQRPVTTLHPSFSAYPMHAFVSSR